MIVRKPCLSSGWYPRTAGEVSVFLEPFSDGDRESPLAIAPHAGWHWSGAVAARAVAALRPQADTVVVLGGHLPAGTPVLYAEEDAVSLPQGTVEIDTEFRSLLMRELPGRGDRFQDNTVEVLLPMVRYFFPAARVLWIRIPNDFSALEAGRIIAKAGAGRNFVALGSTDLTHYGENYGFSPKGRGLAALDWVKAKNDRDFIDAVLRGDAGRALALAGESQAACSPGPVLACMGIAEVIGAEGPDLLEYATSADVSIAAGEGIPESFVGYGAIAWD